jgi:hypothetical protein
MIFPPSEIALKIAIALGVGLLVGFEREWAHKEVGVRTFSLTALLGTLAALESGQFTVVGLVGVVVLAAFINGRLTGGTLPRNNHLRRLVRYFPPGSSDRSRAFVHARRFRNFDDDAIGLEDRVTTVRG